MSKVLFFAHFGMLRSRQCGLMEWDDQLRDLKSKCVQKNMSLQRLDNVMVAVNEEFATDSEVIKEGDTVAFIPPVSGG